MLFVDLVFVLDLLLHVFGFQLLLLHLFTLSFQNLGILLVDLVQLFEFALVKDDRSVS